MGEVWGAAIVTVVGGAIAGRAQEKKDKGDKAHDKEMTREGAKWNAALSEFEAGQTDYYNQLNRQRKQRGLDNFRQFSQLGSFAPQYQQTSTPIEVPTKPNALETFAEPEEEAGPAKKKKSGGLMRKLTDPLGLF